MNLPAIRYVIFIMLICAPGYAAGVPSGALQMGTSTQATQLNSGSNQVVSQPAGNQKNETVMTDIYDIKKPEVFGVDPVVIKYIGYTALGILTLIITAISLYYFFKRKKKGAEIPAHLSPEDTARRLLDALSNQTGLSYREYYFRLSAILRGYIKGRFDIDAPEMTTEELLPKVANLPVDKSLQQHVRHFLQSSDPIKFAGRAADRDKMQTDFQFVRDFVRQTTAPDIAVAKGR